MTVNVGSMGIRGRSGVRCDGTGEELSDAGINMALFYNYTRRSCLLECRAQKLREDCGCLPYYFPDFGKAWNETMTCNATGLRCLAQHSSEMHPQFVSAGT